jgi:beta-lactamase class A
MHRSRLFLLGIVAFLAVSLGPRLWLYQQEIGPIPPGVIVAGIDLGEARTLDEAARRLNDALAQPVIARYAGQPLVVHPSEVGFQPDLQATLAEAASYRRGEHFWRGFWAQIAHQPPPRVEVPLRFTLDTIALARWFQEVASRNDRAPQPPHVIPGTGQIAPGRPGRRLDAQASVAGLIAALTSITDRQTDLVVVEEPAPKPDISLLRELLWDRLKGFPGIAAVWIRDIRNRREIGINEEVAYAAMSTLKIPILIEVYRRLNAAPDTQMQALISDMMLQSGNYSSNQLLGFIGDGDPERGAQVLTDSLRRLGLHNTFMAAPFYSPTEQIPHIVTPANQRKDLDTKPDPFMQTTAKDMGLLMEMIVQCADGGGTLLAAYPGQITPDECHQMIDWMLKLRVGALLELGLPEGTPFAHKHGFIDDTHGDVGAVWGPNGPFVLSVFLYKPVWLEWPLSSAVMADIARITYEFLANYPP